MPKVIKKTTYTQHWLEPRNLLSCILQSRYVKVHDSIGAYQYWDPVNTWTELVWESLLYTKQTGNFCTVYYYKVIFHAIQRLELDTGSSWKLQFDKEKKQQNKIQKSCNFQKYDLGKGHVVVQWVDTGDSKAVWGKKKSSWGD